VYETLGLWRTVWLAPQWKLRKRFLVLVTALQPAVDAPALRGSKTAVEWRSLTEADIDAIRATHPGVSDTELRRRWHEGQACVGGWVDGALAHVRWDSDRRTYLPYLKRAFEPLTGDTLVVEAFTRPDFRGRGIHSQSTALAFDRARARGLTRSITMVASWNAPALHVLRDKAGREVAGSVGYWQVGPVIRHFATGAVRLAGDAVRLDRAEVARRG
jgi:GNAT superfamily N-acetyltransferase